MDDDEEEIDMKDILEKGIILLIIQPRYLTLIWKNFPTKESSTLVLRVSINFIAMMCDGGRDQNKICFWTFKATAPWMDHQITNCLLNNRLMQLSIHYAAYRIKEHISYTWSISIFCSFAWSKRGVLDKSTYFARTKLLWEFDVGWSNDWYWYAATWHILDDYSPF